MGAGGDGHGALHGVLHGRRVVVTRAADQADELVALLTAAGAVPVPVPLIAIEADPSETQRLSALNVGEFDWLVVTSPNGAQHYLAAHGSLAPTHVAAVGSATAAALVAGGVPVQLVPAQQRATGLLAEFPPGPGPGAGHGTVLVVQAAAARPELEAGLAAAGWQVTTVAPYRSMPARPSAGQHLAALSADAVLFASGSAARAWVEVFGTSTPPVVVAIGPSTAAAAEQAGLKVALVAADHSVPGLVAALERHLIGNE